MELLTPFIEEFRLGIVDDPHTRRKTVLTEMVTVCPACRSFHSLRHEGRVIYCTECAWSTREKEPAHAA